MFGKHETSGHRIKESKKGLICPPIVVVLSSPFDICENHLEFMISLPLLTSLFFPPEWIKNKINCPKDGSTAEVD